MQSVSSRIWTRVAVSISYDDNHYTTDYDGWQRSVEDYAVVMCVCVCVCVRACVCVRYINNMKSHERSEQDTGCFVKAKEPSLPIYLPITRRADFNSNQWFHFLRK